MTLIIFIIVLSVLVLIHELGHFLAARILGVKALEFGIGFPPRACGMVKEGKKWKYVNSRDNKEYRNTILSINWLPFGGFVKLKGEDEDGQNDSDSLIRKPIWKRLIIMAAGVSMNWLLAAALFFAIFVSGATAMLSDLPTGAQVTDRGVMITQILPGSPADKAGVQTGDMVLSVGGIESTDENAARDLIAANSSGTFALVLQREQKQKTITLTPSYIQEIKKPGIGVGLSAVGKVRFGLLQAAWQAVYMTAALSKAVVWAFGGILKDLVVSRKVTADLTGPVGIAVMTGEVARQGFMPLLQFAAILSVNLAVINFLPIPALDGGRVLFLAIEKVRRRPMSRKLEIALQNAAFIILILIIVLVTARDLFHYSGLIIGSLKGLVGM